MSKSATNRGVRTEYETAGSTIWIMGVSDSDHYGGCGGDEFVISEDFTNPRFHIEPGGNIGIGTASPASLLHIGDATTDTSLDSTTYLKIAKSGVVRMQLNSTN